MKILVYAPSALWDPHFGMQMEDAESLYREGNEVFLAYCDGFQKYCFKNPQGDPQLCKFCRFCAKRWTKKNLSPGIKIIPVKEEAPLPEMQWDYRTVRDIKNIVWKDALIGYGVMSSFTTATRDPEPDLALPEVKKYFDYALNHAVALTDSFCRLLEEIKPDVISIFNGRFIEQRPLYDIALKRNIQLRVNESVGGLRTNSEPLRVIYYNHLPHSIPYTTELIQKVWEMSEESEAEKERKGRDFFERRRKGVPAGDRVYIANQQKGLLPEDWDESKRNIVIFNSSEDEFAAVGKDFEDYAVFESQLAGIHHILTKFSSPEYHFYLRIHPNLAQVEFAYHTALYDLPKLYKNLTVIAATAPCSTYDLLDAAEKVIVFGSTMGVEAAYWGKPTILLAGAFYHELDVCYAPKTPEEIYPLIECKNLPPKARDGAIKYGYYILNHSLLAIPKKYIDYALYKTGRKSYASGYARFWGSLRLARFIKKFFRQKSRKRTGLLPEKTS